MLTPPPSEMSRQVDLLIANNYLIGASVGMQMSAWSMSLYLLIKCQFRKMCS